MARTIHQAFHDFSIILFGEFPNFLLGFEDVTLNSFSHDGIDILNEFGKVLHDDEKRLDVLFEALETGFLLFEFSGRTRRIFTL